MLIDIHTHTNRYSACSVLSPVDLVDRALTLGLSGIAITEHNIMWAEREVKELKAATGAEELLILRGREVAASIGHLLIFGYYDELLENSPVEGILEKVHEKGGIVILAHPFRSRNTSREIPNAPEGRFACVDAVEVFSGNHTSDQNEYCRQICETFGLVGVGGSDAHSVDMVGKYLTSFSVTIMDEDDLISEIGAGRCRPIVYRLEG